MAVTGITNGLTQLPKTQTAWWTCGLSLAALLIGPVLGFALVGLLLAIAAIVAGITAVKQGERSWLVWLGVALAIGVVCYVPFMSSDYPYTNS